MPSARHGGRFLKAILTLIAAVLVSFFGARPACAQESALEKGPAPPYTEPELPPAPAVPVYDPLRAEKSVEIGAFYMKRGNYDADIERFQDATRFEPKLARPYSLLGEAYERKGEVDNALAAYRKYLQVYRTAPDRDKILKRIDRLEGQAGHPQPKQKSG
jgi:tetratricopeptide (TPR) repeat protein